jgi:uroporphyrinogen-III synthase
MERARILSTRALSDENVRRLEAPGFVVDTVDFIEIKQTAARVTHSFPQCEQVLITSQNAVQALEDRGELKGIREKRILCVGTKTERMLLSKGVGVAQVYRSSEELAKDAVATGLVTTFFTGKRRSPFIERAFREQGLELEVVALYDTRLTSVEIPHTYGAVLFFSPSGVESFFLMNELKGATAVCIGRTTEGAVLAHSKNTSVAAISTEESMIETTLESMLRYEE